MRKLKKSIAYLMALVLTLGLGFGVAGMPVQAGDSSNNVALFRLYNPNTGEHFYTKYQVERDSLIKGGWNGEGYAWMSPESSDIPVYRLYNPNNGDHHYTTNGAERSNLLNNGWSDEGIGWYSSESQAVPVYRQYNPNCWGAGSHNYTTNAAEASSLIGAGWSDEGIGWYGVNAAFPEYPDEPERTYGPFTESQITAIKQSLGVPLNENVQVSVGEPYYWSAGQRWLAFVNFTNGVSRAGADCDTSTGECIRSILGWG